MPHVQDAILVLLRCGYTISFRIEDGTFRLEHRGGEIPTEARWAIQTLQQNRRELLEWLATAPRAETSRFVCLVEPASDGGPDEMRRLAQLGPIQPDECDVDMAELQAFARWWAWDRRRGDTSHDD